MTISSFLSKIRQRFLLDKKSKNFIRHNQKRWANYASPAPGNSSDAVVLVDLFEYPPAVYTYGVSANILAKQAGARIETFIFARDRLSLLGFAHRRLERLYEAFGARKGLTFNDARVFEAEGQRFAERIFAGLKSKEDVLQIEIEGVNVGDLIYDSYLRSSRPTVDIRDAELKEIMRDAYMIFHACKRYFETHRVVGIITSHWVYISHGVMTRLAFKLGIPVYYLLSRKETHAVVLRPDYVYHPRCHEFHADFLRFPPEKQQKARQIAREALETRLMGKFDPTNLTLIATKGVSGLTGYNSRSSERILKDTPKPKVLVLLSCFFDSPHSFRYFLFPDFWEWIVFLLENARSTDFEWYVKPHPSALPGNDVVVARLKEMFPEVHFLPYSASNKQLVEEGVAAMFTTYGTAGHEFAYMGVPVVNAGDNPHIAYDFNFHPKTREELKKFVEKAGHLQIDVRKEDVEEFFYMNYFDLHERPGYAANGPIIEITAKNMNDLETSEMLASYVEYDKRGELDGIVRYFEDFFRKNPPRVT